ncbi:DUF983 domain-containing protein [Egicoccus sp. AB-alg6-2]|uniref:DUF983 domain-containing protein n=1 Tax=Egicoccus sp. AB-alg6-2 TaxID=3242692 RepID=UPI00359D6131
MDGKALSRGLQMRCPICGTGELFTGFFTLRERCPTCDLEFEREDGYWLGAMVVALGITEAIFGLVFVGGMVMTWPDVPWTALLVAGLALNAIVPVALYPWSKTTWMGLHHAVVTSNRHETERPR